MELKSILLAISSNEIKGTHINWYIFDLVFTVVSDIEGKCWWIIGGGGGATGMLAPFKIIGGPALLPLLPCPTPIRRFSHK